ncbi:carbon storage regulator CsrA [Treponema sp. Marseille-Q3903]|jgi:carbon storage regulator|uniref:carbon storage regulator CsrA n=1 Tax=Treponema sp. Marseille-Q3903 TaxID=2766703 RepID=UPI0016522FCD|nr:carbon storage regulator CsrA [Treponema sp. Marseille-Q3903]MBC6713838.1 carbon storage regulator CsrA [Treponema sp. Marseille-Q3903]
MLILSRKIDEKIKIGDNITITLIDVHGDQVKIGVEAPKSLKVFRQEVFDAIQSENKAAVVEENDNQNAISAVSALSNLFKR